nr:blue copper protein-like [Ipomoea batatas]
MVLRPNLIHRRGKHAHVKSALVLCEMLNSLDSLCLHSSDDVPEAVSNSSSKKAAKSSLLDECAVFNTDTNHSVIQTYNFTTYKRCNYDDDDNATQWSYGDPSATSPQPTTVPVPLMKVGMTYFFSGDYDGEQCRNGQRFRVNVTYGQGLPPSLKTPDESPAPVSPQSGDDDAVPDTLVPAYFDNPRNVSDEDSEPSGSVSLTAFSRFFGAFSYGVLVVLGLACII